MKEIVQMRPDPFMETGSTFSPVRSR
jgi:hypothetical protein